ncbi:GFA family protein [Sphingomicrobium lutaoense]|uniref:CENP-V/GFA domain-containing protein n=1 Tax=Sphingomicrobium lutaoense TaxID=515949 RepID=A0A839YYS9_9SPHN|nr:GFA family protein [Sphingomicrobium lutaoense]MBB3764146.1 hypothetical protein [Sphingomicrobium lutaoense]
MTKMLEGGCHCGAVRYRLDAAAVRRQAICHCRDCQRHSGAPMVAWALVDEGGLSVTGDPGEHCSSPGVRWQFCPRCGTGLFYRNASSEGRIDVQAMTFDDPGELPDPVARVQMAEAVHWVRNLDHIPAHDRFPDS